MSQLTDVLRDGTSTKSLCQERADHLQRVETPRETISLETYRPGQVLFPDSHLWYFTEDRAYVVLENDLHEETTGVLLSYM